jgi:hypothetical protein
LQIAFCTVDICALQLLSLLLKKDILHPVIPSSGNIRYIKGSENG